RHVTRLTGTEVMQDALLPTILVAVPMALLAGDDDDQRRLDGRKDSTLTLELRCAVPFVVELVSTVDAATLEHDAHSRLPAAAWCRRGGGFAGGGGEGWVPGRGGRPPARAARHGGRPCRRARSRTDRRATRGQSSS